MQLLAGVQKPLLSGFSVAFCNSVSGDEKR